MSFTSEVTIVAGRSAIAIATTLPSTISAVLEIASNAPTCRAVCSLSSGKPSTEPNRCAARAWVEAPRQVSATTVAGTSIGVRFLRAAFSMAANVASLRSEAMIAPESRMILTEQRELRGEPSAVDQPTHGLSRTKPHTQRGFGRPVPAPRHALRSARTPVCRPSLGWLRSAHAARSPQLFPTDQHSE